MISINNLTVAYGGFTLLNEINFHISENDKIGLVGKNGAGKSTILKLICGLQSPTNGKVAVPNDVKIGYLPQIMEHHRGRSVIDEAMTAFADMFAQEAELERITQELAERTGIRPPTVSAICVGSVKHLPVDALEKICDVLDCQPADLMEFVRDGVQE